MIIKTKAAISSKNFFIFRIVPILLFSLLFACTSPTPEKPITTSTIKAPTETGHPHPVPTFTETPTVPSTLINTPTSLTIEDTQDSKHLQNTQYKLTADLNYVQHFLSVEEQIVYTNNSNETLNELVLMVEPNRYPGVFNLTSLTLNNDIPIEEYILENNKLTFTLNDALAPGKQIVLHFNYTLSLPSPNPSPDIRPIPFGYTPRQTNLVDWYPYIPPYVPGGGWLAHSPWFFGEHQVYEKADFRIRLRTTDGREDLTIAASAPAIQDGEWYQYEHLNARNFVWSVSHNYNVLTQNVGDITVMGYYFPFDRVAAEAAFQTVVESMELYQEIYAPYPRETMTIVEADFLDGMEFDGLFFLSTGFYNSYQGSPGDYLIAIASHETSHQWWYALVGNDQALEPWLDEAMATYSERLYYERYHPDVLDWWWKYRINYYQPEGAINRTIYDPGGYRAYRNAVYLNGALFLEDVRKAIGDTAFFGFLIDYAKQESDRLATAPDFFRILELHTNVDLLFLKNIYFK